MFTSNNDNYLMKLSSRLCLLDNQRLIHVQTYWHSCQWIITRNATSICSHVFCFNLHIWFIYYQYTGSKCKYDYTKRETISGHSKSYDFHHRVFLQNLSWVPHKCNGSVVLFYVYVDMLWCLRETLYSDVVFVFPLS